MLTLLTGVITSAILSLLLALGRKSSGGQVVFRYATPTIWVLFIGIVGTTVFVAAVFKRMSLEGSLNSFDWMKIGALASVDLMFAGAMIYTKHFSVRVDDDQIVVRSLIAGERRIMFASLERIDIIQGAKSQELSLFKKDGKKTFNVGASLQGFGQFAQMLETRTQTFGVAIRHRDKFGKWS